MSNVELSDKTKKNLLDLRYNKYLQYYNTSIIILFTYFIAIFIVLVTKQLDYKNIRYLSLVGIISAAVLSLIAIFLLRFKGHEENILNEIKNLKI